MRNGARVLFVVLCLVCSAARPRRRGTPGSLTGREPGRTVKLSTHGFALGGVQMVHLTLEMPEGALASLRKDPAGFTRELRLAAAVKWYELRQVSQGRAAEIAGLSRAEFIDALARFCVSPFQYDADEVVEEARRA